MDSQKIFKNKKWRHNFKLNVPNTFVWRPNPLIQVFMGKTIGMNDENEKEANPQGQKEWFICFLPLSFLLYLSKVSSVSCKQR